MSNYEDSGLDFILMMDRALQKYGVPSGVELDKTPQARGITVRVSQGTVADILDAIIAQAPGYKWVETSGVVNVMPKHNANSLLNLQIARFQVHDAAPSTVRMAIVSLPEVKAWLALNRITDRSVLGLDGPARLPPTVSLDVSGLTLREIMNRIVKRPGFSSWLLERYGEKNQYLQISID